MRAGRQIYYISSSKTSRQPACPERFTIKTNKHSEESPSCQSEARPSPSFRKFAPWKCHQSNTVQQRQRTIYTHTYSQGQLRLIHEPNMSAFGLWKEIKTRGGNLPTGKLD